MKSGIYKILNKKNNKCYIGSSSNLIKRKRQHFNSLIKNKHYNQYLQRSVNKYGIENFEFIVICKCMEEDLITLEQYYINKLNPEYNAVLTAGKTTGYKFTEEQRKYQSDIRGKSIIRIDLSTEKIIDEWKSAAKAAKDLNLGSPTTITACCKGKIPSAYGYYWSYSINKDTYKVPNVRRCQPKNKESLEKAMQLYQQGLSISKIAELTNLSYMNVYYNCKQKAN